MTPFAPSDWPRSELRVAAQTLWDWHRNVQGENPHSSDRSLAYAVCEQYKLPSQLVDAQSIEGGRPKIHTVSDLLDYVDAVAGSHALLLAKLAGYTSSWIEAPIKNFARAIFLTRSVCFLKDDVELGQYYIPLETLEQSGIQSADLKEGKLSPMIRSVLWKQLVRARDAYASCRTLNTDLSGWARRRFRVYWTGGLHLLARIEARKFDVWSKPVELRALQKIHVYWHTYIGRKNR